MNSKFIIYQMLPRLFANGKLADISTEVLAQLKKLNISYLWLTGIIRHATAGDKGVKGTAGSPFAIKDYYDINPYLATDEDCRDREFTDLIDRAGKAGIGIMLDFVPNHVSPAYESSREMLDDTDFHPGRIHDWDWSDTVKLNYSNRRTWEKMKNVLAFWASRGVAGFRCDMVELVPVEFWQWCIGEIKKEWPGIIFVGEAYNMDNYGPYIDTGGFDYLYDKSGFYDTLKAIVRNQAPASSLTGVWQKIGKYQDRMLNFLENHDEDRLTSPSFASDAFRAFAALFVSMYFNTAPFMIYSGQEFGEGPEKTSIFDFGRLPSTKKWADGIKKGEPLAFMDYTQKDIYAIYRRFTENAVNDPVLRCGKTFDLEYANPRSEYFDPDSHFAFLRSHGGTAYLCAANFSDKPAEIAVHIPGHAFEYLGISEDGSLNSSSPVRVRIERNSGTLLKIK